MHETAILDKITFFLMNYDNMSHVTLLLKFKSREGPLHTYNLKSADIKSVQDEIFLNLQ